MGGWVGGGGSFSLSLLLFVATFYFMIGMCE